jgi:hypothetical protein
LFLNAKKNQFSRRHSTTTTKVHPPDTCASACPTRPEWRRSPGI